VDRFPNASQQFFLEWSDCSDLIGRSENCFDDARADLSFKDASQWFKDRFLDAHGTTEERFDVIIMDAL
jgi:hypothetical protein